MHDSVHKWAATVLTSELISGCDVLDVGSLDVNGSLRPAITALSPRSYVGIDMRPGPLVDVVMPAEELGPDFAHVVVSTEMLEHAYSWHAAVAGLVRAIKPGGMLVLTTRGPGFAKHDHPGDYWRFTVDLMTAALESCNLDQVKVIPDDEAPGVFATARKPVSWPGIDDNRFWALGAYPVE